MRSTWRRPSKPGIDCAPSSASRVNARRRRSSEWSSACSPSCPDDRSRPAPRRHARVSLQPEDARRSPLPAHSLRVGAPSIPRGSWAATAARRAAAAAHPARPGWCSRGCHRLDAVDSPSGRYVRRARGDPSRSGDGLRGRVARGLRRRVADEGDVPLPLGVRARCRPRGSDPSALVAHQPSRGSGHGAGPPVLRPADRPPGSGGFERDHRPGHRGKLPAVAPPARRPSHRVALRHGGPAWRLGLRLVRPTHPARRVRPDAGGDRARNRAARRGVGGRGGGSLRPGAVRRGLDVARERPGPVARAACRSGARLRAVPHRQRGGPAARRRARRVHGRWPPVGPTAVPISREVSAVAPRRPCGACARRPPRRRRAAAGNRLRAAVRRRSAMTYRRVATLLALSLVATGAQAVPGPWQRTEAREPCASFELFRQPYFGDTHVHTAYSSDAVFAGTRENPRGAYRFAEGEPIGLPPYDAEGTPTRTAQLRRPLDFTAVTDHAEQFGEIQICLTLGLPGYDSDDCVAARDQLAAPLPALPSLLPPPAVIAFLLGYGVLSSPQRFSWCGPDAVDCLAEASLVWQDTQAAAEEFYDRTAACTFTTFAAYEWSGQPGGNNLHRNVIFRNAVVPALPTSYMEQPTPQGLWATLQSQCVDGLPGCDVLAIPHNPNASGGLMFAPVATAADAAFRASMEPLVEMNQHKGDSECRSGVQSTDEICGFEKLN